MNGKKIKVLIVDDSAIVRDVLSKELAEDKDIEVLGTAPDPYIARNKIIQLKPDVITLDIEMPKMDGLTFLEKLMSYYPIPVIIVSSVTTQDPHAAIKALEMGAFDVVNKPGASISVKDVTKEIAYKIKQAYQVKDTYTSRRAAIDGTIRSTKVVYNSNILSNIKTTDKLIAIGASTGGTTALEFIVKNLPQNLPPILITQHMPENYTRQFASRLNDLSPLTIKEAEDGEIIQDGYAYIAKGGYHLVIERRGANLYNRLDTGERVHFQKPAVDVMFNSVARESGRNTLAILLTGMGKDGATGLKTIKEASGFTVAQDEHSSVVWGMPKAAFEINAHKIIAPLSRMPEIITDFSADKVIV